MILVDTSVIITYLKGTRSEACHQFQSVINLNLPFGINHYIYLEVLQSSRTPNEYDQLKEYLGTQKFYFLRHEKESFEQAAKLYMKCRTKGITIRSTLDMLIVQTAIENEVMLLHDDRDYDKIAGIEKKLRIFDTKFIRRPK